jgi:hypothetical protein
LRTTRPGRTRVLILAAGAIGWNNNDTHRADGMSGSRCDGGIPGTVSLDLRIADGRNGWIGGCPLHRLERGSLRDRAIAHHADDCQ